MMGNLKVAMDQLSEDENRIKDRFENTEFKDIMSHIFACFRNAFRAYSVDSGGIPLKLEENPDPDFQVAEAEQPLVRHPNGRVWHIVDNPSDGDSNALLHEQHSGYGLRSMTREEAFRKGAFVEWRHEESFVRGRVGQDYKPKRALDGVLILLPQPFEPPDRLWRPTEQCTLVEAAPQEEKDEN